MRLGSLQAEFAAALLAVDGAAPAWVGGARPDDGFGVYRNNVHANYRSALRAIYAVVAQLVGDAFFDHAADRYAAAHPSQSGDIHGFGGNFGSFLSGLAGAEALPYLPDTARLEWLLHESFHAADQPPLDPTRLVGLPPDLYPRLRFVPHASVRLLEAGYPVKRIWEIHQPAFDGAFDVDLESGPERLLLARRHGFDVLIEPLGAGEYALLQAFAAGEALAAATGLALEREPDFELPTTLQRRVADGTLADIAAAA